MLSLDLLDGLAGAASATQAATLLLDAARPLGFTCLAIVALPETGVKAPLVAMGWPAGWVERFVGARLDRSDPVLNAARNSTDLFRWSAVRSRAACPPLAAELIDELRQAGIVDGIVVPVVGLDGGQWAVILGGAPGDLTAELCRSVQLGCLFGLHCVRERGQPGAAVRPRRYSEPAMSVHAVRLENQWLYERELGDARRLFGKGDSWLGPLSGAGASHGAADVNLIAIERRGGRVAGWVQLHETTGGSRPGVTAEPRISLRSPSVLRISGLGFTAASEGQRLSRAGATLLVALQEYGLKCALEQLTLDAYVMDVPALLELGWNPDPLGPARSDGRTTRIWLTVDISEAALKRTRRLVGIGGSVVVMKKLRRLPPSASPSAPRLFH